MGEIECLIQFPLSKIQLVLMKLAMEEHLTVILYPFQGMSCSEEIWYI